MSYAAATIHFAPARRRRRLRLPHGLTGWELVLLMSVMGVLLATTDIIPWLIYTPAERAEMRAVNRMLDHIQTFRVACPAPQLDRTVWNAYVASAGWQSYPEAGVGCVSPTKALDYQYVINFEVACPAVPFNAADTRRWAAYAAHVGWPPYPAAGTSCVDP